MPMPHPLEEQQFATFLLVLVRVARWCWCAPIFGPAEVPPRLRGLLAMALALLIAPIELHKRLAVAETLPAYAVQIGAEALVGLSLGLGILVLFSGMRLAGQVISQMSGLQLADVFDPGFDASVPVVSQLLFYVTLAVFVTTGGHRMVMEGLLDTFVWLPAGEAHFRARRLTP